VSLYDTRFFFEHYYSDDPSTLKKTGNELSSKRPRYVSVMTIHELYKLILEKEGRDVAELRIRLVTKDFEVIPMDEELAVPSAEIRSKHLIPMADSVIAATAKLYHLECVSDDPHFAQIREIKTRWI
jgi:predicted nucleic acid-binding protein